MSLKIEVQGSYVKNVTGKNGANAGKQFQIPMVECYAHLEGEKYPVRADFSVEQGGTAPKPGVYILGPGSFYVNEYGQLAVKRSLQLLPVPVKVAA